MRFGPRLLGLSLTVALMLPACEIGSPGSGSPESGPGASSAGENSWGPAKPMTAMVTLDTAKASSALITVRGGTLSATGTDGTKYTLTIPDMALGGDEKITMTPIQAMGGLPVAGGLVAGVQLVPDGLELFRMATLTMTPTKPVPANPVAMSHHGMGDNLHLHPLDRGKAISVHVLHFSGVVIAPATDAELKAMADRRPRDAADQAAHELGGKLAAALRNPGSDIEATLEPLYKKWFESVVVPKLNVAIANYTVADDAIANALAWERDIQIRGDEARYAAQITTEHALIQKVLEAVRKGVIERCLKGHDVSAAAVLISLERQRQLMGFEGVPINKGDFAKCLRFELDFETISPFLAFDQFAVHARVLRMVLQADEALQITGSQAHEIVGNIDMHGMDFRFENVKSSRPFTVLSLGFTLHFLLRPTPEEKRKALSDVTLTINPGEVTGDALQNSLRQGQGPGNFPMLTCPVFPEFAQCWTARHYDDAIDKGPRPGPSPTTFKIKLERNSATGSSLLARASFQPPCFYKVGGMRFECGTEATTFDLRHAPAA